MARLEGVSIEAFRGDYEGLERMAHASWRDEYGQASFPNFYRPAFLRYLFDRIPEAKKDHLLAAYQGGEIVAFLANLPQKFHFRGRVYGAVNLVAWTFNPGISLAGIPVVYEIQV